MNSVSSLLRTVSKTIIANPLKGHLLSPIAARNNLFLINSRSAHNAPCTYDFARERIMMICKLFDKIDPEKITLESHFIHDLGLDSLDQVEIIMEVEYDFQFDIPDKDMMGLVRPIDIVRYITDHEEAYEELQKIEKEHGHGHDDHHEHDGQHGHHGHGHASGHAVESKPGAPTTQVRAFHTSVRLSGEQGFEHPENYPTTFLEKKPKPVDFTAIQERVMKVLSKYDKIDSSKLEEASHLVDDLGLDSLDHVEIIMELEDEFGLEIPDQEAEKLMRPSQIARYVFEKEEKRSIVARDHKY